MKTVIYCRVSSKEQEESGYSLPAQEKLLREYCQKKQFAIAKVYSVSESASGKSRRKTFEDMMVYVTKEKIKVIVCEKVDRLTRNLHSVVVIDKWLEKNPDRQIHLVKDSLILHKHARSQEKLSWGIQVVIAKNKIDNLSEEVIKGQQEKLAQGGYPGRPKLGYQNIISQGHKQTVIDPTNAPLIQKMFELYATGEYSTYRLADTMDNLGLKTTIGNKVGK